MTWNLKTKTHIYIPTFENPTLTHIHNVIEKGTNIIKIIDPNNFEYQIQINYNGDIMPFENLNEFLLLNDNSNNIFTNNYSRRSFLIITFKKIIGN